MPDSVLVVATREPVVRTLEAQLRGEGFEAEVVGTSSDALERLRRPDTPHVVIVDASIGTNEARELCTRIRAVSGVPILVFASERIDDDLIDYLDHGAHDVLARPDRPRELVARVRALLRRLPLTAMVAGSPSRSMLLVGDVCLDPERHIVTLRGVPVELPLKQFQLLELFLANAGQLLTRTAILRRVWGKDAPADSNTLEVQIKRLRRKIEDDPSTPTRIRTVRGLGYIYAND